MPRRHAPISLPQEECFFYHGIALFNAHRYFDAHEIWEEVWRPLPPCPKKVFYQGLIQAAVALEHFRRGNLRGALTLHHGTQLKLSALPSPFMGLGLTSFLASLDETLAPLRNAPRSSASFPPAAPPRFNPALAPLISLLTDPFATGEAARLTPPA